MKQLLTFLAFSTLITVSSLAQNGAIQGIVTEEKSGNTVPFVDIKVVELNKPAQTDMDGKYVLNDIDNGTYTLVFRMEGYRVDTLEGVVVKNNAVDVSMKLKEPAATEIEGFEVVHKIERNNAVSLINLQKNDASVKDGVDAKSISKNGDGKVNDVLKRISGASIQDNRFVVIRGLGDRYNSAYINGAPLPSSESDKKAFAFDIFPSNMLDNLTITKTATPELPGEFAGGVITLNTKSPSNKEFHNFQIGTSVNRLTTFQNYQSYGGSSTDWLGVDNGARAIPDGLPTTTEFSELNARQKADYAKKVTPSWGTQSSKALPALSLQYGIGRSFQIKKRELGFVFAYTYQNQFATNYNIRREFEEQADAVVQKSELKDSVYTQKLLNSGMFNTSFEINKRNKITLNNLYSVNSEDKLNVRRGVREMDIEPVWEKASNRWFTENKLYTGQLQGKHDFKLEDMNFNWTAGYSDVQRAVPNQRRIIYQKNAPTEADTSVQYVAVVQNSGTNPVNAGNMFWSKTKEKIYSFNYALAVPLKFTNVETIFKAGGSEQYRDRTFDVRNFGFSRYKATGIKFDNELLLLPEDQLFAAENLGLKADGKGGFKLEEATKVSDSYQANSTLHAGFFMFDTKIKKNLRLVGGVRLESYNQQFNYTENKLNPDGSYVKRSIDTTVLDVLPSINAIYSLNKRMNVRASFSKTVSRPEFRELAPFAFYNFAYDNIISGDTNLQRTTINNFDVRYEYFIGNGQLFTISGFYKEFKNPIELINRAGTSGAPELNYANVPKAINYGIETEFRLKLDVFSTNKELPFLSGTTLYTNFALIKSVVDVKNVVGSIGDSRPLQGQSPYIVNTGLQYEHPTKEWSINASYNIIGRRIFIVGNEQEPDVWENSRNVIDLQFAKTFKKNFQFKINLRDLLAQTQIFYQDVNLNQKFDRKKDSRWQETTYGQSLSFSLSYNFGKQ